jgi:hypothetical protein
VRGEFLPSDPLINGVRIYAQAPLFFPALAILFLHIP